MPSMPSLLMVVIAQGREFLEGGRRDKSENTKDCGPTRFRLLCTFAIATSLEFQKFNDCEPCVHALRRDYRPLRYSQGDLTYRYVRRSCCSRERGRRWRVLEGEIGGSYTLLPAVECLKITACRFTMLASALRFVYSSRRRALQTCKD